MAPDGCGVSKYWARPAFGLKSKLGVALKKVASPSKSPTYTTFRNLCYVGSELDLKLTTRSLREMSKSSGKKRPARKGKALLLGVGLDSDGHKRITTGPSFALVGGTQETHEVMTEKAIKINEKLSARGKTMDSVSREEFDDIAASVGLQRQSPPQG